MPKELPTIAREIETINRAILAIELKLEEFSPELPTEEFANLRNAAKRATEEISRFWRTWKLAEVRRSNRERNADYEASKTDDHFDAVCYAIGTMKPTSTIEAEQGVYRHTFGRLFDGVVGPELNPTITELAEAEVDKLIERSGNERNDFIAGICERLGTKPAKLAESYDLTHSGGEFLGLRSKSTGLIDFPFQPVKVIEEL